MVCVKAGQVCRPAAIWDAAVKHDLQLVDSPPRGAQQASNVKLVSAMLVGGVAQAVAIQHDLDVH